jgi:hypothetical protein
MIIFLSSLVTSGITFNSVDQGIESNLESRVVKQYKRGIHRVFMGDSIPKHEQKILFTTLLTDWEKSK